MHKALLHVCMMVESQETDAAQGEAELVSRLPNLIHAGIGGAVSVL